MKAVFLQSTNIISPLGNTTEENFVGVNSGMRGVKLHAPGMLTQSEMHASLFPAEQISYLEEKLQTKKKLSKFELLLIASVNDALNYCDVDASSEKTVFIVSTTKGNIDELDQATPSDFAIEKLELYPSAKLLADFYKNPNDPLVISNACISGVAAVIVAQRLLKAGLFENAIIVGADTIGSFVYSGFHSFQAFSPGFCKPFSSDRDGINLGEAAATMILSVKGKKSPIAEIENILIGEGSMSNDANHISGPSRTGEELGMSIRKVLNFNQLNPSEIGLLSAHGTATPYNDEMEAKAIHFAGLENVPLNSLKGYFGHTLGAAGLLESIISIESMKKGLILASKGFSIGGMDPLVNVCSQSISKEYQHCVKMASGFGGCNAVIVYSKKII